MHRRQVLLYLASAQFTMRYAKSVEALFNVLWKKAQVLPELRHYAALERLRSLTPQRKILVVAIGVEFALQQLVYSSTT